MKKCTNCGHIQEDGKFCGKCGTSLNETVPTQKTNVPEDNEPQLEQQTEMTSSATANVMLEKVKNEVSQYTSYFMDQLKKPSKHFFNSVVHYKQSIISVVIYVVLYSLFILTLLAKMGYESDLGFVQLPPKTSIMLQADLFLLVVIAIGMLSAFVTIKLFGPGANLKTIVSQCTSFFIVPIIALLLAILAILLEFGSTGSVLLAISLLLVMLVIPMYVVLLTLNQFTKTVDRFYAHLFSIAIIMIFNYIFYTIILNSAISSIFGSGY